VQNLARRPALIVLMTDFLVAPGWATPLRMLAQRHEVVAARMRDPREVDLPDLGLVSFEDPESGEQFTVDTSDRRLRECFARAAVEQGQRIDSTLVACGVDQVMLDTDQPLLPVLAAFLEARRRRRGVRANVQPGEGPAVA